MYGPQWPVHGGHELGQGQAVDPEVLLRLSRARWCTWSTSSPLRRRQHPHRGSGPPGRRAPLPRSRRRRPRQAVPGHLAEGRIRRGRTADDLAARSGLPQRLITELESGRDWADRRRVVNSLSRPGCGRAAAGPHRADRSAVPAVRGGPCFRARDRLARPPASGARARGRCRGAGSRSRGRSGGAGRNRTVGRRRRRPALRGGWYSTAAGPDRLAGPQGW